MVDLNTSSPPAKSSPYVGTSAENSWGHVKDSWRATATAAPISISVSDIRVSAECCQSVGSMMLSYWCEWSCMCHLGYRTVALSHSLPPCFPPFPPRTFQIDLFPPSPSSNIKPLLFV
mmetsp:Transcript_48354/g.125404  ORF Transcript_48354/g.125404 Transcript_48354/m.125404 type:complete len:118 (-) Transcript_48354:39-392(-)